tara:strand:+ start:802 stop:984 length:183 start_codon:yes stop_codon:yes gene_type:complete
MNPLWAVFFKDRFRTPFSVYKMSLAEIIVLLGIVIGVGIGIGEGISWIIDLEGVVDSVPE